MNVFILASCPGPTLLPGCTLVFDTLRLGFPNAKVFLDINQMNPAFAKEVGEKAKAVGATIETADTIHHDWISNLLATQREPFYILDTDVRFNAPFESFTFLGAMAGRRTPQFYDEFTRCVTRPRLHTSLLYFDPVKVNAATDKYFADLQPTAFNPHAKLVDPLCMPFKGKTYFYDTCSMLYNAIGGESFTDRHLECFEHMNFGTLDHLVLPRLSNREAMAEFRNRIVSGQARNVWREQDQYYESRAM